jgi:hypothetical protein
LASGGMPSSDQSSVGQSLLTIITNRDAAIESHASSIHRAWPVSSASPAPIVAIKRAKPASAQTKRIIGLSTFALFSGVPALKN